jgi:hypothetical protein
MNAKPFLPCLGFVVIRMARIVVSDPFGEARHDPSFMGNLDRRICPACGQLIGFGAVKGYEATRKTKITCPRYDLNFLNVCTDLSACAVICASVTGLLFCFVDLNKLESNGWNSVSALEEFWMVITTVTVLLFLCATAAWFMAAVTYILKTVGCPTPQDGWPPLGSDAHTPTITDSSFSWYAVRASSIAVISVDLAFIYCRIIIGEEPPKYIYSLLRSFPFFLGIVATAVADILWFMAAAKTANLRCPPERPPTIICRRGVRP